MLKITVDNLNINQNQVIEILNHVKNEPVFLLLNVGKHDYLISVFIDGWYANNRVDPDIQGDSLIELLTKLGITTLASESEIKVKQFVLTVIPKFNVGELDDYLDYDQTSEQINNNDYTDLNFTLEYLGYESIEYYLYKLDK
jgi:hypothetical protein